ncbi:MAG: 2-oxoacid:acceptor oxidoreductase subunit alpha [Candidatus Thorarchaeota archaeon]|jgi:2-oxoglutarate ferredoxin oxidoreductase subunit alpha
MDITFNIGGEAGQGIDTIGDLLTQVFVKAGFYTFTIKDFMSRIRGGYNFTQIRVSDKPIFSAVDDLDVIIALSHNAVSSPRNQLVDGGIIIFDDNVEFNALEACHYPAPLLRTAREVGGNVRMMNAAALGAILSILQFPFHLAEEALTAIFQRKGDKIVSGNVAVAKALYDQTSESFNGTCKHNLSTVKEGPSKYRLIITGSKALALGAMAANVKWISSYPMSPSTSAFEEVVSHARKLNIGAIQTEDEIAALGMALGASFAGARSMTTTSGGGFSLMVEGVGLAAMTETPVVIYNAQRPGPSTGLPTRTEQSDLLFMAFSSQGEFPRIILAPKDPPQGFDVAARAFNLADLFQVPVMILGDQYFADSVMNIAPFDTSKVTIDRGLFSQAGVKDYKRHSFTRDGVSPRAYPGEKGKFVVSTGNVHFENGHISEDADVREAMVQKLMKKIPNILKALNPPEIFGKKGADFTLLTWGSSWGPVNEAMNLQSDEGVSVNQLHFCDIYPLKTKTLTDVFKKAKKVVAVEQNATSQFAKLVRMESGLAVDYNINKFDGRPITPRWVSEKLKEVGIV